MSSTFPLSLLYYYDSDHYDAYANRCLCCLFFSTIRLSSSSSLDIAHYTSSKVQCRTMAIETAMKSSAFGFLLAKLHFAQYLTRVPSAVSVVWMALVGATLAVVWRYIPIKDEK